MSYICNTLIKQFYKRNSLIKLILCMILISPVRAELESVSSNQVNQKNTNINLFVTWEGSEPDKGASAWLIKRFVNKDAYFKMIPKGEAIQYGIPFDVPESEFRRTHQFSTFETIQRKYNITDPTVLMLGKVIHDLEINTWGKNIAKETPLVKQALRDLRQLYGEKIVHIDCNIALFDVIFSQLKNNSYETIQIHIPPLCVDLEKIQ